MSDTPITDAAEETVMTSSGRKPLGFVQTKVARTLELSLARRDALLLEAVTDRGPNFARRVREELETK